MSSALSRQDVPSYGEYKFVVCRTLARRHAEAPLHHRQYGSYFPFARAKELLLGWAFHLPQEGPASAPSPQRQEWRGLWSGRPASPSLRRHSDVSVSAGLKSIE